MPSRTVQIARWGIAVIVGALLLVFATIGFLTTFRGTPIRSVHIASMSGARLQVSDSSFRSSTEALTSTRLMDGNQVEILLNGDLLQALWRDLRGARTSIGIRNYYALPGNVADTLAVILAAKAAEGVQVQFLFDSFGSEFSSGYLRRLREAGVDARGFRPLRWYNLNRAQNRSHVRAVVIDGEIGYTGGFGIADKWLGDGREVDSWRETSVRFIGPAVMQLQAVFSIGWAEATGSLQVGPQRFPPDGYDSTGGVTAGLLYAVPTQGSTQAERFLVLSILGASRTLYITNSYFVPDDDQRRLLIDAARRGVDVRILTAGRHTDVQLTRLAGRANYEELLRGGVRIYEYDPTMIHSKTLVADGLWATIGTMNFDNRSAALNEESNLVFLDAGLGARMDSIFFADLARSTELRLPAFSRRPWIRKVQERAAALLSRLL